MEVVGYCQLKKNAVPCMSAVPAERFLNDRVRVLEFSKVDGSVLVVDRGATGLASFNKEDIEYSFECSLVGDVILPPGLTEIEKIVGAGYRTMRKGGYPPVVREMVIMNSLRKGKFDDDFLFQKEREEAANAIPFPVFRLPRKLKKAVKAIIRRRTSAEKKKNVVIHSYDKTHRGEYLSIRYSKTGISGSFRAKMKMKLIYQK